MNQRHRERRRRRRFTLPHAAFGCALVSLVACGDRVDIEPNQSPTIEGEIPEVEVTTCRSGAVRFVGDVADVAVDEDWCTDLMVSTNSSRSVFAPEERLLAEGRLSGPLVSIFVGDGELRVDAPDVASLDRAVVGWPPPLGSPGTEPLCAGPGSWFARQRSGSDTPERPYWQARFEDLSRLMPCQPGDASIVIESSDSSAVGSMGGGFAASVVAISSAGSGEFRIFLDNGAYVFARLEEALIKERGTPPEAGDYTIADAFAWYDGEFFCAGRGTVTLVGPGGSARETTVSITDLGSAGACPGTPIDGALDVFRLPGDPFQPFP
ncbi:MAG: hypothetical protein AAGN82_27380 [Myxococcota bacterium]